MSAEKWCLANSASLIYLTFQEFGNILLAISYLPTAQRLTINIMKLRDVRFTTAVSSLDEFSKYRSSIYTCRALRKKSLDKSTRLIRRYFRMQTRMLGCWCWTGGQVRKWRRRKLNSCTPSRSRNSTRLWLSIWQSPNSTPSNSWLYFAAR